MWLCFVCPVGHFHRGLKRHDLGGVFSRSGRGGDPLLAFDDISIERFARDVVFLGDEIGGLVHRPPHRRHPLFQRLINKAVQIKIELHQADAFDATGDHDAGFAAGDAVGGDRGGGQARSAVAIDRHARHRDAETGFERRVARDVVAGRPFRQAAAENDIFDFGSVDAGALDNIAQDMRGHWNAVGLVEGAAAGFGDAGSAIGDNSDVFHGMALSVATASVPHEVSPRRDSSTSSAYVDHAGEAAVQNNADYFNAVPGRGAARKSASTRVNALLLVHR
jgi:hypothetical protein